MLGNVTGIIDYSVCVSVCLSVSPYVSVCVKERVLKGGERETIGTMLEMEAM